MNLSIIYFIINNYYIDYIYIYINIIYIINLYNTNKKIARTYRLKSSNKRQVHASYMHLTSIGQTTK